MEFLVFGASGRTGRAFVHQALAANHAVTAFVRDAAKLPDVHTHIGNVLDASSVAAAVRGTQTIVVTLGRVDALTQGCANVIHAAVAAGVQRILGVVGAGVLQADATHQRFEVTSYPPMLQAIARAHQAFHVALAASPLDWTLACTPNLVVAPATGFVERVDYLPDGTGAITTEDVAAFLLAEAIAHRYPRTRVGLNGTGGGVTREARPSSRTG